MTQKSLTSQSWKNSHTHIRTHYQQSPSQAQVHSRGDKYSDKRKCKEKSKPLYSPLDKGIITLFKHQSLIIAATEDAHPELIERACLWDSLITIKSIEGDACKISIAAPQAYGFKINEISDYPLGESSPIFIKRIVGQSIVISPINPLKNLDEIYEVVTTEGVIELRVNEIGENHLTMAFAFNKAIFNTNRLEVVGFKDSISAVTQK